MHSTELSDPLTFVGASVLLTDVSWQLLNSWPWKKSPQDEGSDIGDTATFHLNFPVYFLTINPFTCVQWWLTKVSMWRWWPWLPFQYLQNVKRCHCEHADNKKKLNESVASQSCMAVDFFFKFCPIIWTRNRECFGTFLLHGCKYNHSCHYQSHSLIDQLWLTYIKSDKSTTHSVELNLFC